MFENLYQLLYFNEKYIFGSQFFSISGSIIFQHWVLLSLKSSLIILPLLFLQATEIIPYLSLNFSSLTKLCLGICCSVSTFHWNLCSFVLQIWLLFQFEGRTIFCYFWIMWFSLLGTPVILMLDSLCLAYLLSSLWLF